MGQAHPTHFVDFIGEKRKGETKAIRSSQLNGRPPIDEYIPGFNTLLQYFKNSVSKFGNEVCLAKKIDLGKDKIPQYTVQYSTYNEVRNNAKALGKALLKYSLVSNIPSDVEGEFIKPIGVYANTRAEWLTLIISTWYCGATTVPLYSTLGKQGMKYIMEETQFSTIFLADEVCKNFAEFYKDYKLSHLTTIVLFDDKSKPYIEECKLGLKVYTFNELIELGLKITDVKCPKVTADSIDTICYTSGTTGIPKGVITTHRMIVCYITGMIKIDYMSVLDHTKSYMANLPMAHVLERNVVIGILFLGARICFANPYTLKDDLKLFKPTFFSMVPRMVNRLHKAIIEKVESLRGFKRKLFDYALKAKTENIKKGKITHMVYDKLVFKQFKEAVGNNLDLIITGAAMCDEFACNQLQALFSCRLINGYGCSETCGAVTLTHRDGTDMSTIGYPIVSVDIKLVDVPELNYSVEDKNPRGELCIKGKLVMPRYYKQPDKTKEMIDNEGWLHTGDVAELLPTGLLKIIDRAKNVFKLSQGEYIVPDKIESIIYKSKYVSQAFIYGNSAHSYLIGVIVPDKLYCQNALEGKAKDMKFEELCKDPRLNKEILSDLTKISKANGLNSLETVKKLIISSVDMTVANDLLTPTFKLKRHNALEAYKAAINEIYTTEL